MRPLILQFAERPQASELDYSLIEYSKELNLSVVRGTSDPAITHVNLETETFTKSHEVSDSDKDLGARFQNLLDTSTRTFTSTESSDSDADRYMMQRMVDTKTITESIENTDSDK